MRFGRVHGTTSLGLGWFQPKLVDDHTICKIENFGHGQTHEALRNRFVVSESGYDDPKSLSEIVPNVLKVVHISELIDDYTMMTLSEI